MKCKEFQEQTGNCQLLKKVYTAWSCTVQRHPFKSFCLERQWFILRHFSTSDCRL